MESIYITSPGQAAVTVAGDPVAVPVGAVDQRIDPQLPGAGLHPEHRSTQPQLGAIAARTATDK